MLYWLYFRKYGKKGNPPHSTNVPDKNCQDLTTPDWLNTCCQSVSDPKKFRYPIHTRLKVKRNLPVRLWSLKVTFPEKNAATLGGISIWQSLRTTQFEDTPLQLRLLVASREDSNGSLNPSEAFFVSKEERSQERWWLTSKMVSVIAKNLRNKRDQKSKWRHIKIHIYWFSWELKPVCSMGPKKKKTSCAEMCFFALFFTLLWIMTVFVKFKR